MGIVFSEEQNHVINLQNRNILVSAAAGSGKTTVLVERIIRMISDEEHPVDIDHLLIVTFTKAAAASMREKISEAISKKLEENYSDHLQRQATLLHHAQITTIDSFCLFILQNNFNDIGLDPGFRVADEGEIRLLKEDVMEQMLEDRLGQEGNDFAHLLDRFVNGNRMSVFTDILFTLYNKALSFPFVEDWLTERKQDYAIDSREALCQSVWMQKLYAFVIRDIGICRDIARENVKACQEVTGPVSYLPMMEGDLALTEELALGENYVQLHERMQALNFQTLSRKKDEGADPDLKEWVKKRRNELKDILKGLQTDFFAFSIEEMLTGFEENDRIVKELCDTILDFHTRFMEAKKEKKLIDFSDMEHFALQILLQKEGDTYVPTKTALEYRQYFHEIMIDEYQDSNLVQEWLLKTISGEEDGNYNRFMVGDVKQSIYQFRLARPQIFMEKFDTYEKEVRDNTVLQRIDLAKNYRSRKEVVDGVNYLFYRIMGRDLGGVTYDTDSALNLGANYPVKQGMAAKTLADRETEANHFRKSDVNADVNADANPDANPDAWELCLLERDEEKKDKKMQEAELIAHRIKELVGNYQVTDDKTATLRPATYGDVVILLRNMKSWDEAFKTVFEKEGIPAYVAKSTGYFSTTEIRTILNFLKTLDNPKQDIPLFGTMTSWFGKFTDEDMAILQSEKQETLYDSVIACARQQAGNGGGQPGNEQPVCNDGGQPGNEQPVCIGGGNTNSEQASWVNTALAQKCQGFLSWFQEYRSRVSYEPIHKILRALLNETGYLYEVASLPGGAQRLANVQMLLTKAEGFEKSSYSGLFHFIRYIEKIQKYDVEFGEASTEDEGADVVRIMTIHKSKGLEFPICFVAGLAGQFNMRDTESALICDSDYGIGLDYVDLNNRVKYKDIRKRFLAKYMQEESLGEELRVLYVALTRAKEKLIVTGLCKSFEKLQADLNERSGRQELLLPFEKRAGARSYLDWILAAVATHPVFRSAVENFDGEMETQKFHGNGEMETQKFHGNGEMETQNLHTNGDMEVKLYTMRMLEKEKIEGAIGEEWKKTELLAMLEQIPAKEKEEDTEIHFVYPHSNLAGLYAKTSVSELKMAAMHKAYEKEAREETAVALFPTEELTPYIPKFAKESREVSGSARGSAYHRLLELLDYSQILKQTKRPDIKESIQIHVESGRITEEEIAMIHFEKINAFLDSEIAGRMAKAQEKGNLYKEQPFVLGIDASRLSEEFPENEKVLIQGIIDVYFVEEDEIVLLDYKTDAVKTGEELAKRYKTQMDYYTEALEKITGRKVKEKILYSFALGRSVIL